MKAVFDTNILIDHLSGIERATETLEHFDSHFISLMTWVEVMVGAEDDQEAERLRNFLHDFDCIETDKDVREHAFKIKRANKKLRMPDVLIWAAARSRGAILVTRNTRDFDESLPDIYVPYKL